LLISAAAATHVLGRELDGRLSTADEAIRLAAVAQGDGPLGQLATHILRGAFGLVR